MNARWSTLFFTQLFTLLFTLFFTPFRRHQFRIYPSNEQRS